MFDSISNLCHNAGFAPQDTLVKAEEGISIAPMWARVFVTEGLKSVRLTPDTVQVELVAAWRTQSPSVALHSFLALLDSETAGIQAATERDVIQEHTD